MALFLPKTCSLIPLDLTSWLRKHRISDCFSVHAVLSAPNIKGEPRSDLENLTYFQPALCVLCAGQNMCTADSFILNQILFNFCSFFDFGIFLYNHSTFFRHIQLSTILEYFPLVKLINELHLTWGETRETSKKGF